MIGDDFLNDYIWIAAHGLVLLGLVILGLGWMRRTGGLRIAGGVLIAVLVTYAVVPAVVSDLWGSRLSAQYQAASLWPDDLSFDGSTVILISPTVLTCGVLCEALFERSGASAVYVVELSAEGMLSPITDGAFLNWGTDVARVALTTNAQGNTRPTPEPAQMPDAADWIIFQNPRARYTGAIPDLGLDAGAIDALVRALHIYAVPSRSLTASMEVTPTVHMVAGMWDDRPYLMPIFNSPNFAPDISFYNEMLQSWICVADPQGDETRCPFLF